MDGGDEEKRKRTENPFRHEVMRQACRYQNEESLNMLTMRLFFRHCAVLYLKGMAIDHLVISKLQHLLENSSNADVHGAMTLASIASQQKIRLYKVLCWSVDLVRCGEDHRGVRRMLQTFFAGCSLKCNLQSMRDGFISTRKLPS